MGSVLLGMSNIPFSHDKHLIQELYLLCGMCIVQHPFWAWATFFLGMGDIFATTARCLDHIQAWSARSHHIQAWATPARCLNHIKAWLTVSQVSPHSGMGNTSQMS